jgi:hypothetical protein
MVLDLGDLSLYNPCPDTRSAQEEDGVRGLLPTLHQCVVFGTNRLSCLTPELQGPGMRGRGSDIPVHVIRPPGRALKFHELWSELVIISRLENASGHMPPLGSEPRSADRLTSGNAGALNKRGFDGASETSMRIAALREVSAAKSAFKKSDRRRSGWSPGSDR